MNVIDLATYSNKDTVAVLKCLLAQAVAGEVRGLAVLFADRQGQEFSAFTGAYAANTDQAAAATLRLSMRLANNRGQY